MVSSGRAVFTTQQEKKEKLADRMGILIDIWDFENNSSLTYPQMESALASKGIQLSRTRWSYLINGTGSLVTDQVLLKGVSDFFGVSSTYLCDLNSNPPVELEKKMEFISDMRKLKVKNFATRNLGALSPETLKTITKIIDSSMNSSE
ncbi:hypothetical protein [Psychromicrobium sp. YIM B11713]|uniref:hypothetical protein n=1 Tax=Psychromicrobium sp. YIM B11713 TaxID=3145233 RepID=UPI00374F933D